VPEALFACPHQLHCDHCPEHVLLIRADSDLATIFNGVGALLYAGLVTLVLVRSVSLLLRSARRRAELPIRTQSAPQGRGR
jgi:hypothetical protein